MKRRERTRQLIELGGLVAKAGLIDLTDDDRAAIFGILIEAAATLRGDRLLTPSYVAIATGVMVIVALVIWLVRRRQTAAARAT